MPRYVKSVTPANAALSHAAAWDTLCDAMPAPADTNGTEPFPAVLRAAIEEAEISVSELARRVAKASGTEVQSERRGLQRYLKGEVVPEPDKAAILAQALGRPESDFVMAVHLQPSLHELIAALDSRLAALEGRIDRRGQAVQRSLKGILDLLEQREEPAIPAGQRSARAPQRSRRRSA